MIFARLTSKSNNGLYTGMLSRFSLTSRDLPVVRVVHHSKTMGQSLYAPREHQGMDETSIRGFLQEIISGNAVNVRDEL